MPSRYTSQREPGKGKISSSLVFIRLISFVGLSLCPVPGSRAWPAFNAAKAFSAAVLEICECSNTAIRVVHQQRPKCHWHAVARGKQAWIGWHQARHYVALRNRPREQNKEKCNDSQVNTHSNAHPRQVLSPLQERVKPLWKERIKKRKYQSLEIPGSTCVPMCLTTFWWREAVIWIAPGGIQWNCRPWPQCQHYESSGWINQSYVLCNKKSKTVREVEVEIQHCIWTHSAAFGFCQWPFGPTQLDHPCDKRQSHRKPKAANMNTLRTTERIGWTE